MDGTNQVPATDDQTVQHSDPVPARPSPSSFHTLEIISFTLLTMVILCGIVGGLFSFVPDAETGRLSLDFLIAFAGLILAGGSSAGLILLRRRAGLRAGASAVAILLWFIGVILLGLGGWATLLPGEQDFWTNFAVSAALCLAPGGFLALAGLLLFGYDYRQVRHRADIPTKETKSKQTSSGSGRHLKLERAKDYGHHISQLIKNPKNTAFVGDTGTTVISRLDHWVTRIRQLIRRLEDFESNPVLQRDIRDVPAVITRLKKQLETEKDPEIQAQLEETLEDYQAHQQSLDSLVSLMRRTELEIDETLAVIGTVYSQLELIGAKDIDSKRAQRLSEDLDEQVSVLGDLLAAMDETYSDAAQLSAS